MPETYNEYCRRYRREHPEAIQKYTIRSRVKMLEKMGFFIEWRGSGPDPRD